VTIGSFAYENVPSTVFGVIMKPRTRLAASLTSRS
jgi:hypothetical protein